MLDRLAQTHPPSRFAHLGSNQIAYVAGLLDGDGSIQIYRSPARLPVFAVHVVISNTDRRIADLLQGWWGVCKQRIVPPHGHSHLWACGLTGSAAADLLTRLTPYTVLKPARVSLALDFHQFTTSRPRRYRSADFIAEQRCFYTAMRMLNARGLDRQELALWDPLSPQLPDGLSARAPLFRTLLAEPPKWVPVKTVRTRTATLRRTITVPPGVATEQAAYAAGLFDSEGHVSIRQNGGPGWRPNLILQVSVVNTDPRAVGWLQATFGGFVGRYPGSGAPRGRDRWLWVEQASGAASFLRVVVPWLVAKRDRAEIAVAFQEARNRARRTGPRTHEVLTAQLEARAQIRAMNAGLHKILQARAPRPSPRGRVGVSLVAGGPA